MAVRIPPLANALRIESNIIKTVDYLIHRNVGE